MTNRRCNWSGCHRTDYKARGLCALHYERARKNSNLRALYRFSAPHTRRSSPTVCECDNSHHHYLVWGTPVCSNCHRPDRDYIAARIEIISNKKGQP